MSGSKSSEDKNQEKERRKEEREQQKQAKRQQKQDKQQPAKVSYFFYKGYIDLGRTIKQAWIANFEAFKTQWSKGKGQAVFWKSVHIVAAICIILFGSVVTFFASAAHIVILGAVLLLIYAGFLLLRLIDTIYISINRIGNACPNPDCQAKFLLPVYECPECGVRHTKLVPGKYGIVKRRCECGAKIPTTFLNGRGKLNAYCPVCGQSLKGDTASRQYVLPVIGGPSVGKTCYINMAIDQVANEAGPEKGWDVRFITETEQEDHERAMAALNRGIRPEKTTYSNLTAYQLMITLPREKVGRRMYIYDIAGEQFSHSEDVQSNLAYSYANGFIFLVDPLTLADYEMEVIDKIDEKAYGASSQDFNDILDIMLINLEKMFGLKDKDTVKMNLAVVINKADIPGLSDKVGEEAARRYQEEHPDICKTYADARNTVCRNFLDQYGGGNFVRTAESKFKQVSYFAVSALGHNDDGKPYRGQNVLEPLLWLLGEVDSQIKKAL